MKRSNDEISTSPTHVILHLSSIYDVNMEFMVYTEMSAIEHIDLSKIIQSVPSERKELGLHIFDNETGDVLPGWTVLKEEKCLDFQQTHHCLSIPCKSDE